MRRYETIFILRPSQNEEEINAIIDNTESIITADQGKIIELDRWGMRKLAYPIKKEVQGFYVYIDYTSAPEAVSEIERKFRIDDSILRYMTVKTDDSLSPEELQLAIDNVAAKNAVVEVAEETTDIETDAAENVETTVEESVDNKE